MLSLLASALVFAGGSIAIYGGVKNVTTTNGNKVDNGSVKLGAH